MLAEIGCLNDSIGKIYFVILFFELPIGFYIGCDNIVKNDSIWS